MTLRDWAVESAHAIRSEGALIGTKTAALELGHGIGRRLGRHITYGTSIWDRDWDVLILLDACRHDVFQEVAPSRDFLPNEVPAVYSEGSMSKEWLEYTIDDEYVEEIVRTSLISSNPHTDAERVRHAGWYHVDQVWSHSWNDEAGTVLPRPVTESSIYHWRHNNPDRMIVWYLQPHIPFLTVEWSEGFVRERFGESDAFERSVWDRLRDGDISTEKVWNAYRRNLNYVLDDVEVLLKNLDAEQPVISSDHGNGFGEWGIYGHPRYLPAPCLKRVPWAEVEATDRETLSPDVPPEAKADTVTREDIVVKERLADLGYRLRTVKRSTTNSRPMSAP